MHKAKALQRLSAAPLLFVFPKYRPIYCDFGGKLEKQGNLNFQSVNQKR